MASALDVAKHFLQRGLDSVPRTFDGNMKLQKLVVFSDLVSLAETGKPLFSEDVLAFKHGCVVEEVRLRYLHDYSGLRKESADFVPNFSGDERAVLDLSEGIFGDATARELSDLNHEFGFWQRAYERSTDPATQYHSKADAVVPVEDMRLELDGIRAAIRAYKAAQDSDERYEVINGKRFFYGPDFVMTEDVIDYLEGFSRSAEAEDDAYSVYYDAGDLVVY